MDQQNEFDKEIYDEKKCTGSFPRPSSPPPPPVTPDVSVSRIRGLYWWDSVTSWLAVTKMKRN